ncbi:alanine racemase [Novosphingobium sp. THN1]|uniref:alanine racemase n=1 Tax=Novosphingobium sp. THN1 TaxID=1016987 RepID=UPI000E4EF64F|nr:alanine racemase [Novosphingobium sp. THN1]AXU19777.1 alanine racemase [Novosphingobium sp. THN1]
MTFPAPPAPTLRLGFDAEALAANWRALDALSGRARAGAAVKADAYGVGAARVVPVLAAAGCDTFFVAHWTEAAEILPLVPAASIAVLHGPLTCEESEFARATGVRPVINSMEQARRWSSGGGGPCHLMVDTGMNRLGVPPDCLGDPAIGALQIDLCMSHLASADEDVPQNESQLRLFDAVRRSIPARRYSLANSAGIALGEAFHADLTRPGLALYGGIARSELVPHIRPVVRPEAALLQTRTLQAGDQVGYNALFTADRAMRIGIISLGYADGYLRCWSGIGTFLWQGRKAQVLGRVSMDLTIVDLAEMPDCHEGDWLTADYRLSDAAAQSGLSQYELLTLMGKRFSRQNGF